MPNILDELEGLRGEQLAVSMLRLLTLRSLPCRAASIVSHSAAAFSHRSTQPHAWVMRTT